MVTDLFETVKCQAAYGIAHLSLPGFLKITKEKCYFIAGIIDYNAKK
jgi:hypothetical protein